jgi:hypothetical protein
VLVAQSLAGFTAPLVCDRRPIDLLVLLNAMIPLPGETGNDWWTNVGSGEAMRANLASLGLSESAAQDDRVLYFHDVPDAVVAEAFARGEPQQSMTPMHQPWPFDAARRPDARACRPRRPPLSGRLPASRRARTPRDRG